MLSCIAPSRRPASALPAAICPEINPPTDLAGSRESAVLSDPTSRSVL